jgi:hypothetical protein
MGFQMGKTQENWARTAAFRGLHDVSLTGPLAQLFALCPELKTKSKEDDSGSRRLPYWLVIWLAAPLHRIGDEAQEEVSQFRLWEWLLDPESLSEGTAAALAAESFDKGRKYKLSALRCALVRSRDLLIKSDSGAAALFDLDASAFFRASRTREGEEDDTAVARVESGDVDEEHKEVKPTVFIDALIGHALPSSGDLHPFAFLEIVLFPRFTLAQRLERFNGFAYLLFQAGQSAFAGMNVDWDDPAELGWMSDGEICETLLAHVAARMPAVAISPPPASVADARRRLGAMMSADVQVNRDVLSLSYLNVAGALSSLREDALARIYSGEENGATLLVLLAALRDASGSKSSAPVSLGDLYALQEVASTNYARLHSFGLETAEERHSKLLRLIADSRAITACPQWYSTYTLVSVSDG